MITTAVQKQVQQTIDELVASGQETGLQVAVYKEGRQVIDAVAGLADSSTGRPMTSETVIYVYSCVKAAASTLVHRLAERAAFGYDTPVAQAIPEFGAHGEDEVTVRDVVSLTAGVPGTA